MLNFKMKKMMENTCSELGKSVFGAQRRPEDHHQTSPKAPNSTKKGAQEATQTLSRPYSAARDDKTGAQEDEEIRKSQLRNENVEIKKLEAVDQARFGLKIIVFRRGVQMP